MERPCTVLIVEADPQVRHALKSVFLQEGYRVLPAPDARAAIRLLQENEVHMLLADREMPHMSGLALMRAVRMRWPWVVRILVTGYPDLSQAMDEVDADGVHDLLLRPWDDRVLMATVRLALEQNWLPSRTRRRMPSRGEGGLDARGHSVKADYKGIGTLHWDEEGNLLFAIE